MKGWITVAEASQRLEISERSVRTWIAEDKLKARKHGRKWLISEESIGSYGGKTPEIKEDTEEVSANTEGGLAQELSRLRTENEFLKAVVEELKKDKQELQDSRTRQDTIILQLTRQMEQSQRLLEYNQEPWYRRMFGKGRKEKKD